MSGPPSRSVTFASRRRIVKEAALEALKAHRSGGPPSHGELHEAPSTAEAVTMPAVPTQQQPWPLPRSPQPLFPPTTAIIGSSLIRNVRFFNATTYCFPGATVTKITDTLPDLLKSFPPSIKRLVVHIGSNDIRRCEFEVLKSHLISLCGVLENCGLSVFISGPLPTLGLGAERFSRLLQLHSWLQSACHTHGFYFIDNFNLFWNRPSFYHYDGLHPSKLGSRILASNIQHVVQTVPLTHA